MNEAVLGTTSNWPVTFLASFLIWILFAGVLVLWVVDGRLKKEQALHELLAVMVAWTIAQMIKTFFPAVRPYVINGGSFLTFTKLHSPGSFPSTHAAVAFALAMTVWLHDKKIGSLFILAALGVGVGRVLGNVHYPVDIIAGGIVGVGVAIFVDRIHLFKLLEKKISKY